MLKTALIENGGGFDARDSRFSGSPNKITIKSMYSNIDMSTNALEGEFQASLEELLWFVNVHLFCKTGKDFRGEKLEFVFCRDLLVNESETIDNCVKSTSLLSRKTILGRHPFVKDAAAEMARIEEERT
jgi:SPP1 family phage portal protein